MAPSRSVVASLVVLLFTDTLAFVVHKRSTYNSDLERGELKDALRLLERQRRRLDNIDTYDSDEPQEWWPSEQRGDDDIDNNIDEEQYVPPADGYLQSLLSPDEDGDSYPYSDTTQEYLGPSDKHSGEDLKETPVPADMQELQNMLEPNDEEELRTDTKRESGLDLTMDANYQPNVKKENKVEQMDPDLVKKMLAEADKMEAEKVNEYTKDEATSTVSPDELKNMLDEEEEKQAEHDRKKKDDTEDAQGEVGAFLAPSDSGDVKKKRSGLNNMPEDSETSNSLDLNYIKKLILLEDRENTNLAQALNFATLAQLDRSGKYLAQEVEFLRNAIVDESQLQDLLTAVPGDEVSSTNDDEITDNIVNEPILQRKRADPELDRPGLEDLSPSDREKAVILSYLLRKGAPQDDDDDIDPRDASEYEAYNLLNARDGRDFQDDDDKPLDRRIYRKRTEPVSEDDESQEAVEGVLRSYLQRMPSLERRQLKDAVEEQIEDIEADEDVCPAVVNLVQGCPLQADEGVELDDEALDLCNRHSLCYSCGAMHGMSADDCDTGYVNEASRKCEPGDNKCNDGITALYLMFLQHHRYIPASATEDMCADRCVIDYVTGADRK